MHCNKKKINVAYSKKFFPDLADNQNHLGDIKIYKFLSPVLREGIQKPVEVAAEEAVVPKLLTPFRMNRRETLRKMNKSERLWYDLNIKTHKQS